MTYKTAQITWQIKEDAPPWDEGPTAIESLDNAFATLICSPDRHKVIEACEWIRRYSGRVRVSEMGQ